VFAVFLVVLLLGASLLFAVLGGFNLLIYGGGQAYEEVEAEGDELIVPRPEAPDVAGALEPSEQEWREVRKQLEQLDGSLQQRTATMAELRQKRFRWRGSVAMLQPELNRVTVELPNGDMAQIQVLDQADEQLPEGLSVGDNVVIEGAISSVEERADAPWSVYLDAATVELLTESEGHQQAARQTTGASGAGV
jgi:hypothetical protein